MQKQASIINRKTCDIGNDDEPVENTVPNILIY